MEPEPIVLRGARCNLKKAKWRKFRTELDRTCGEPLATESDGKTIELAEKTGQQRIVQSPRVTKLATGSGGIEKWPLFKDKWDARERDTNGVTSLI